MKQRCLISFAQKCTLLYFAKQYTSVHASQLELSASCQNRIWVNSLLPGWASLAQGAFRFQNLIALKTDIIINFADVSPVYCIGASTVGRSNHNETEERVPNWCVWYIWIFWDKCFIYIYMLWSLHRFDLVAPWHHHPRCRALGLDACLDNLGCFSVTFPELGVVADNMAKSGMKSHGVKALCKRLMKI